MSSVLDGLSDFHLRPAGLGRLGQQSGQEGKVFNWVQSLGVFAVSLASVLGANMLIGEAPWTGDPRLGRMTLAIALVICCWCSPCGFLEESSFLVSHVQSPCLLGSSKLLSFRGTLIPSPSPLGHAGQFFLCRRRPRLGPGTQLGWC